MMETFDSRASPKKILRSDTLPDKWKAWKDLAVSLHFSASSHSNSGSLTRLLRSGSAPPLRCRQLADSASPKSGCHSAGIGVNKHNQNGLTATDQARAYAGNAELEAFRGSCEPQLPRLPMYPSVFRSRITILCSIVILQPRNPRFPASAARPARPGFRSDNHRLIHNRRAAA